MYEKINRALSFVFLTLILLVPLALFPRSSEIFEFNKIIVTYLGVVLITFLWISKMIIKKKWLFKRTLLDIPLIIFLFSLLLSTIFSLDSRTSFLGFYSRFHGGFLSYLSYSLLYWAWVSNMDRRGTKKAIFALMFSGLLVSLYGVLQHFGIDKEIWVQDVQRRVFSTLGQPNWLAAWLVALIPISILLSLKTKPKGVWIGLSLLFFLTLLYTKSRSGMLGFLVSYLIFWVFYFYELGVKNFKEIAKNKTFITISVSFFLLVLIFGTPWTEGFDAWKTQSSSKTLEETQVAIPALEGGGTESGTIRKIVWSGAIDIWKNYPILGSGVETFSFAYYQFRPLEHNLVSEWDFIYNRAHNEYLNFAATTGTLGILSYLLLLGTMAIVISGNDVKSVLKDKRLRLKGFRLAFLSSFAGILITNFFGFSVVPTATLLFLFPAFSTTLNTSKKRGVEEGLGAGQKLAMVIPVSISLYLVFSIFNYWRADYLYARGKILSSNKDHYELARNTLLKATEKSPGEAVIINQLSKATTNLALDFLDEGNEEKTIEYLNLALSESRKSVSISPKNVNLYRERANMFIKLSLIEPSFLLEAEKTLLEALTLAPNDAKLYYNLGLTQARIGKIEEAKKTLEYAVDIKQNYRKARLALSLVYSDLGERQGAIDELQYILDHISPNDPQALQQLGEL